MFNNNQRKGLKAWVRYDGNNNAVAGSLIFQKDKPKVGKWKEFMEVSLCCPSTTSTTTTAVPSYSYTGGFDFSSGDSACNNPITNITVYSADSSLVLGSFVYPEPDLTGGLADGYIAFDGNYYQVYGNEIIDIQSCPI